MSAPFLLLSAIIIIVSLSALVKPATLFAFPVVSFLLLLVYILPQIWMIQATGSLDDFDLDLSWTYMLACLVMALAGFRFGTSFRSKRAIRTISDFAVGRLLSAALVASGVGLVAYVLMLREALTGNYGSQWTGVITLYALLATLLIYGTTLSWLIFLKRGSKLALFNAVVGYGVSALTVLIAARREIAFGFFTSILLGLVFTRNYRPPRALIAAATVAGALFINGAGPIRSYMTVNKVPMTTAIANVDLLDFNNFQSAEVSSAVTDIAIANWNSQYIFFENYYNTFVQLYFPAFILGREAKDNAKIDIDIDNDIVGSRFNSFGATRTGFASSYLSFHFFGSIVFLLIFFIMGIYWKRAKAGDIEAQFYYIALLPDGLKIFTESPERYFGGMPFLFGTMVLLFAYARLRTGSANKAAVKPLPTIGTAS